MSTGQIRSFKLGTRRWRTTRPEVLAYITRELAKEDAFNVAREAERQAIRGIPLGE